MTAANRAVRERAEQASVYLYGSVACIRFRWSVLCTGAKLEVSSTWQISWAVSQAPARAAIARVVDAGVLVSRLPDALARPVRCLLEGLGMPVSRGHAA